MTVHAPGDWALRQGADMQVPAPFEYERATSVDHALALLERHGPDARLIAGGHSLLPMMKLRLSRPEVLVDALERRELVREVGDSIAECDPPQVFGVHGDWGLGKTSFMHHICTRVWNKPFCATIASNSSESVIKATFGLKIPFCNNGIIPCLLPVSSSAVAAKIISRFNLTPSSTKECKTSIPTAQLPLSSEAPRP